MEEKDSNKIRNFRDLEIWKKGMGIVKGTYKATDSLPRREVFGLISQMRRSAVSIPSNIAEGFNRFHNKEYRHLLYVTLGSCAELETQLEIAGELGYLASDAKATLLEMLDHESRMIRNLVKRLNQAHL